MILHEVGICIYVYSFIAIAETMYLIPPQTNVKNNSLKKVRFITSNKAVTEVFSKFVILCNSYRLLFDDNNQGGEFQENCD